MDGSLKNFPSPFLPFMRIHGVENLFATRKFICVWISIVSSNAKKWIQWEKELFASNLLLRSDGGGAEGFVREGVD